MRKWRRRGGGGRRGSKERKEGEGLREGLGDGLEEGGGGWVGRGL
jgi:hypothetical protein